MLGKVEWTIQKLAIEDDTTEEQEIEAQRQTTD